MQLNVPKPDDNSPYAHMDPSTLAEFNEEMRQAEEAFAPRFKDAEAIEDPVARQKKIESARNCFRTKQSTIRKKYGCQLKQRRSQPQIPTPGVKRGRPGRPPGSGDSTRAKRLRTDDGTGASPAYLSSSQMNAEPPSQRITVADMQNQGLGGSSATAAMQDPTLDLKQPITSPRLLPSSLSSLQKKGYRVESNMRRPAPPPSAAASSSSRSTADPSNEDETASRAPQIATRDAQFAVKERYGSASGPVGVNDVADEKNSASSGSESDSESDSDGDIPARVPFGERMTGTPQQSLPG